MIIRAKFLIAEPVFRQDLKRLLDAGEQPAVQVNGHPLIGRLLGLRTTPAVPPCWAAAR